MKILMTIILYFSSAVTANEVSEDCTLFVLGNGTNVELKNGTVINS